MSLDRSNEEVGRNNYGNTVIVVLKDTTLREAASFKDAQHFSTLAVTQQHESTRKETATIGNDEN
jgi:hypothetical protein